MFWFLTNNIEDNYEFIMEFLNYEKINVDNNIVYIFNNSDNKNNNDNLVIDCNIKIKENIILYSYNDKKICFSFKKEDYFGESKIKYYYKKETLEKMPNLLSEKYDFDGNITFNITILNKSLSVNDSIGRFYNII